MPSFARHLAHPVAFFKSVKVGQRTRGLSCALMEKLHRVDDGLQHAECQRNSDEALGWHELQSRRTTLWIRALERI